jgi:hypothetical protein
MAQISIHPHARARMLECGADETEVIATVQGGERFPAKFGRVGFRRNFQVSGLWRGRHYQNKQIEAYAIEEGGWLVLTVIVKYF